MKNLGAALLVVVVAVGSFLAGRSMESERAHTPSPPDEVAHPPTEPALELQRPLRQADVEKLLASVKSQQKRLENAAGGSLPPPAADVDTTKSAEELIAQFHALPPGEREPLLRAIMTKLRAEVRASKNLEPLDFFRTLLKDPAATTKERSWAVIVAHTMGLRAVPGLLDYYEPHLTDSDATVRMYAVEGLAWIKGDEQKVAREKLRAALDDPVYKIREVAALTLGSVVKDPRDADLLENRLMGERHEGVAHCLLSSLKRLDPEGYQRRLRDALSRVEDEIRPMIEKRLE